MCRIVRATSHSPTRRCTTGAPSTVNSRRTSRSVCNSGWKFIVEPSYPYSPECVEGEFCELRLYLILGSCSKGSSTLGSPTLLAEPWSSSLHGDALLSRNPLRVEGSA